MLDNPMESISKEDINNKSNNFDRLCQGYRRISEAIGNLLSASPSVGDSVYQAKWEEIKSEMSNQLVLVQNNLKNSDNIRQSFDHMRNQIGLLEKLISHKDLDSNSVETELNKIRDIYTWVEKSFKQLSQLSEEVFSDCHKKFQNLLQEIGTVEIKELVKELEENKKEQRELMKPKEESEINLKVSQNEEGRLEQCLKELKEEKENLKSEKSKINQELIDIQKKKKSEHETYEKTKTDLINKMRNDFINSREKIKQMIIDRFNKHKSDRKAEHERLRIKNNDLRAKFSANSSLWGKNPYEDAFNENFRIYCNVDTELKTIDQILTKDLLNYEQEYEPRKRENENNINIEVAKLKIPSNYEQEIKILNNKIEETNKLSDTKDRLISETQEKLGRVKNEKLRHKLQSENYEKKTQDLKHREETILKIFKNQGHNSPATAYVYFESIMDFSSSIQNSVFSLGTIDNFSTLIQKIITYSLNQVENILNSYEITNIEKMSLYNKLLSYIILYIKEAYNKTVEVTNIKFKNLMNASRDARKANIKKVFCDEQSEKITDEELEDLENEINTKYEEMSSGVTKEKKNEIIKKNMENIVMIMNNLKMNLILK